MLLTSSQLMGTVVASRWQMQAYKDGDITCVLKVGYTAVKKWVRYIALHPGACARKAGFQEELVARLRKDARGGGAVLGPFKTAESLWKASKDGTAFKLGMSLSELRIWVKWMAKVRGEESVPIFVYRIFPAEESTDLVWNGGYQVGDDWASMFARSKNQRGGGIRFYVKRRSPSRKVSRQDSHRRCDDGISWAQWCVLQAQPTYGRICAVPREPAMPHVRIGPVMPHVRIGPVSAEMMPYVQEEEGDGAAPAAGPNAQMPHAFFRPIENEATVEMARLTEVMARAFRETGQRNGMDAVVLIAVGKMEEALASVGGRLADGSLHGLTVALYDLRMAIEEYAWAVNICGWDAGYIGRVRDLARIITGIERNMEHSLHLMVLNGGV